MTDFGYSFGFRYVSKLNCWIRKSRKKLKIINYHKRMRNCTHQQSTGQWKETPIRLKSKKSSSIQSTNEGITT